MNTIHPFGLSIGKKLKKKIKKKVKSATKIVKKSYSPLKKVGNEIGKVAKKIPVTKDVINAAKPYAGAIKTIVKNPTNLKKIGEASSNVLNISTALKSGAGMMSAGMGGTARKIATKLANNKFTNAAATAAANAYTGGAYSAVQTGAALVARGKIDKTALVTVASAAASTTVGVRGGNILREAGSAAIAKSKRLTRLVPVISAATGNYREVLTKTATQFAAKRGIDVAKIASGDVTGAVKAGILKKHNVDIDGIVRGEIAPISKLGGKKVSKLVQQIEHAVKTVKSQTPSEVLKLAEAKVIATAADYINAKGEIISDETGKVIGHIRNGDHVVEGQLQRGIGKCTTFIDALSGEPYEGEVGLSIGTNPPKDMPKAFNNVLPTKSGFPAGTYFAGDRELKPVYASTAEPITLDENGKYVTQSTGEPVSIITAENSAQPSKYEIRPIEFAAPQQPQVLPTVAPKQKPRKTSKKNNGTSHAKMLALAATSLIAILILTTKKHGPTR